jgi:uncharacterized protein YbjT (DUF2867 family)
MENYFWQLEPIKHMNSIFVPLSGDVTAPMIATTDIAERAARVITGPAPSQPKIISLHGPKDYSMDECAKIISQGIGKEVQHVQVTPEQAKASFLAMGATEGVADAMLEMYAAFQAGKLMDEIERTPDTTTPTTFETFVKGALVPALRS